ncbi:MAG: methyltransferase, partial [Pseudomonadota bacterium]
VFLQRVAERYPDLNLNLFDLPAVIDAARARLGRDGRIAMTAGSFLADPFPQGSDGISLIRVLYDHTDTTVAALLARVFEALPGGGRVIVSEPMSGGAKPCRAGDAYFGFYTMAMTTGRARSAERHMALLAEAGFVRARQHPTRQPMITSVITAEKA